MKLLLGVLIGFIMSIPATTFAAHVVRDKTEPVSQDGDGKFYRFDDPDFKVKCWRYASGYKGGLSCLPWDEVEQR